MRWISPVRAWREARQSSSARARFAAGVATGVFIANLPVYGVQSLLSLYAARRLRLHPLAVLAGSHLSTPPIGALLIMSALVVGHSVLHRGLLTWDQVRFTTLKQEMLSGQLLIEWVIGSLICGTVLALATFVLVRFLLNISLARREAPLTADTPANQATDQAEPVAAFGASGVESKVATP